MKTSFLILAVFMLSVVSQAGIIWEIYGDETINSGDFLNVDIYDSQDVPPIQTTVDMMGGDISILSVNDTSIFNLKGGKVDTMFMYDTSTANLTGGTMWMIYPNGHTINVYGTDFIVVDFGSDFRVSGAWEDGSPFQIQFARANPTDGNISFHEIPEPSSFVIFTLSAFTLLRKRKP